MSHRSLCFALLVLLLLAGCAVPSAEERRRRAHTLAEAAGWSRLNLATDRFDLAGYVPADPAAGTRLLTVYIEGDGLAWISGSLVSADPTPLHPVGLKLALRHPTDAAAYLARPCQFGRTRNCSSRYWTSARFAPEVVAAFDQAIDRLKERFEAQRLQLVGYSGGGALAALVAAQRDDVALLVTVAGNLDHAAWTAHHRVSPLSASLNPADAWRQLAPIPQVHYIGGMDATVPAAIARSFAERFPAEQRPAISTVAAAGHGSGWEDIWPNLYLEALAR